MKTKPAVHQIMGTCSYGDAIGNMALEHRKALRNAGYDSQIFAERIHPGLADTVKTVGEYDKYGKTDDIIIYHLSIGSAASEFIYSINRKIVLYYHNITPARFFEKFHEVLWLKCSLGREELKEFAEKSVYAVADSEYNRMELEQAGFERTSSLPVPIDFERLKSNGSDIIRNLYEDDRNNLLFVGRIMPNKKIEDVIKLFHLYRKEYDESARLFIVGSYASFESYMYWLWRLVKKLGEEENIIFSGHISDDDLAEYYKLSDIFIMTSEHEGFGVPLLEAFYANIPVIAYDYAAVGETMNGGGVLLSKKDFSATSQIVSNLMKDEDYRKQILESQKRALKQYSKSIKNRTLIKVIEDVIKI